MKNLISKSLFRVALTLCCCFVLSVPITSAHNTSNWDSNWGPLEVKYDADGIAIAYYADHKGGFIYLMHQGGNIYHGHWAKTKANKKCSGQKNGRDGVMTSYYGKFVVTVTEKSFSGKWGYCDATPTESWSGTIK